MRIKRKPTSVVDQIAILNWELLNTPYMRVLKRRRLERKIDKLMDKHGFTK